VGQTPDKFKQGRGKENSERQVKRTVAEQRVVRRGSTKQ
jgi:hypothetical protein